MIIIKILNLTKFRCPYTMINLRKNIKKIQYGEIVLVLSNDNSTKWDIPLCCNFMNFILMKQYTKIIPYQFLIKKIQN